MSAHCGE